MLVLILAPAAVMAAGQQGQAQGIGNEAGNCLNVQQQTAGNTMTQEKSQNAQGQGNGIASQNGDIQKLQTRSNDQTHDQDKAMVRNMTRDQIQQGSDSGPAGESREPDQTVEIVQGTAATCRSRMNRPTWYRTGPESPKEMVRISWPVSLNSLGVQFRNAGGIFQALGH